MEDLIKYKDRIEGIIAELGKCRREIEGKGKDRAMAIANYDKRMAVTIVCLRDGQLLKIDDREIKQLPVSVMEKVAKGICQEDKYQLEVAESAYKACITNMQVLMAQLNAFQSVLRYLEA